MTVTVIVTEIGIGMVETAEIVIGTVIAKGTARGTANESANESGASSATIGRRGVAVDRRRGRANTGAHA